MEAGDLTSVFHMFMFIVYTRPPMHPHLWTLFHFFLSHFLFAVSLRINSLNTQFRFSFQFVKVIDLLKQIILQRYFDECIFLIKICIDCVCHPKDI